MGLLSLGMHPLETVQAGQEGRSKADQGPYQLPSCRVMQVRQVPGMARQWGGLSRSHPGGNYCVFSSSPAHNMFLCLLGDWASVDGVTSFLCTLLINMCVSECMAVVRDIVFWSWLEWWTRSLWESWERSGSAHSRHWFLPNLNSRAHGRWTWSPGKVSAGVGTLGAQSRHDGWRWSHEVLGFPHATLHHSHHWRELGRASGQVRAEDRSR